MDERKRSLRKEIVRLALPIALQQFMTALVGACDAIMLGKLSQDAMSAVSLFLWEESAHLSLSTLYSIWTRSLNCRWSINIIRNINGLRILHNFTRFTGTYTGYPGLCACFVLMIFMHPYIIADA